MNEEKANEIEQSAWNLSQMLIVQISSLLQEISSLYTKGNLRGAFFKVKEIRFLIHADLEEMEIKECKRLEMLFLTEPSRRPSQARSVEEYFLSKYREYVFVLLSKYGYLVSKKEDSSRMF